MYKHILIHVYIYIYIVRIYIYIYTILYNIIILYNNILYTYIYMCICIIYIYIYMYISIYIYIYIQIFNLYILSVKSFMKSWQKKSRSTFQRVGLHFKASVVQFHQTTFSLCLIHVPSCPKNVIISVC